MKILFIHFFVFSFIFSFAQLRNGLVAEYNFNEADARDAIGSNNAKEVSVSYVDDRFGNRKKACFLHGSNSSYLNLGCDSILKPVNGSISIWFKIDIPVESGLGYKVNPIILTKCAPGDDFFEAYAVYYNYFNNRIGVATTLDSSHQIGLSSHSRFHHSDWNHVVMAYNHDSLFFYLNGKLESKIAKNFRSRFLKGDSVMVGNSANKKNKRFLCGSVDDIKIFDRVLPPSEIKELYEEPNPDRTRIILNWFLVIAGIMCLIILIIFVSVSRYRKALKAEREKNELQNLVYETQMRTIKAQMNPHFIFNSLNSIQQFILSSQTDEAYKYLVKFSKLVRKLLETSTLSGISLEDEIDILKRYTEMEALRFEDVFNYNFSIDENLKLRTTKIPQMLIQPFIENAIWHGLLHKKGDKLLNITFSYQNEKCITCEVEDNGVGRSNKKEILESPANNKSLAINLVRQRLQLINKTSKLKCGFDIIDLKDTGGMAAGTKIVITIPILNQ